MHSWEDFAETFAFYLDMVAVLDTAQHTGVRRAFHDYTLAQMLEGLLRRCGRQTGCRPCA